MFPSLLCCFPAAIRSMATGRLCWIVSCCARSSLDFGGFTSVAKSWAKQGPCRDVPIWVMVIKCWALRLARLGEGFAEATVTWSVGVWEADRTWGNKWSGWFFEMKANPLRAWWFCVFHTQWWWWPAQELGRNRKEAPNQLSRLPGQGFEVKPKPEVDFLKDPPSGVLFIWEEDPPSPVQSTCACTREFIYLGKLLVCSARENLLHVHSWAVWAGKGSDGTSVRLSCPVPRWCRVSSGFTFLWKWLHISLFSGRLI